MLASRLVSLEYGGIIMEKKTLKFSHKGIALALVLVLVLSGMLFAVPSRAADTSSLGQLIDSFESNESTFTLISTSRFFINTTTEPADDLVQTVQLAQRQFAADAIPTAAPLDIVWGDPAMVRDGDILIQIVEDDADIGAEGYKLHVTAWATVTVEDVDGLLYGLNMLQKHLRNSNKTYSIKGFTAWDTPDTAERTVQLDCARKYFTKDWICNFIREMSWMGYNTLQLHFSEDGGYRADLWDPDYYVEGEYEPENDFSWLCGSITQYWTHNSSLTGVDYTVDPDANRYLTTAELIEIINTCKEYHIDIIPSFDSPAHMDYLTWKFEQHYIENSSYTFKYNGTTYKAADTSGCINYTGTTGLSKPNGYYTTMDIRDSTTRGQMSQAFVFSIYKDMADFFSYYAGSTKFNIGADEVVLTRTGAWAYSEFPGYINELNNLLNAKGYTTRMFNDFIEADYLDDFADNIEILYWNSPFNTIDGDADAYSVLPVSTLVDDGRILYNCINQHTYYVLRINDTEGDARSETCHQWEFYGADEENIYNYWAPNNIRKKGVYTEPDAIVPDAQLGGAYFLLWNDYAAVNTEVEMWNGVTDFAKNTGEFYSLRDRMWSNSIKQWNWDINTTHGLSFADYETLRDSLGDLPGLGTDTNACSQATVLPTATDPIHLSDHTALTAALATKIEQGDYSDQTYAVYESAYNAALIVNNDNRATAEQIGQALDDLNAAIAQLKIRTDSFTVDRKTVINGVTYVIDSTTYDLPQSPSDYNIFVPYITGYDYLKTEVSTSTSLVSSGSATFTPLASGDGSGYLTGTAISDMVITIWYENAADLSRLNALIDDTYKLTEQGSFTDASWAIYTRALENAENFALAMATRQSDVDILVKALEDARTALVVPSETTAISIERLSESFLNGEQVGLYIKTTANIPSLSITNKGTGKKIALDICTGEVQELNNGETVKYWVVFFPAEDAGTFTYVVSYELTSAEITVIVN